MSTSEHDTKTKYNNDLWPHVSQGSRIPSLAEYEKLYAESISDPETFWAKQAQSRLSWIEPWKKVYQGDFAKAKVEWFSGGKLNLCANALDRHVDSQNRTKTALIWEGDTPGESRSFTYAELHAEVCKLALVLKAQGVKKGDRVTIYLPMIPELVMSLLACARIGAVHCVIFGGFSPDSIKNRVLDSQSDFVITSDGGYRGGVNVPIKANMDQALVSCPGVRKVLVVKRTGKPVDWRSGRDFWLHEELDKIPSDKFSEPEPMSAEDPLFILYTSGSTGKPKGVLHSTAGYGLYATTTFQYVFDSRPDDVYFCSADIGWVTGHSYLVYGPLISGATTLMFEGVPTYPGPDRFWEIIDRHHVSVFYTSPTAIRSLMRLGEEPLGRHPMAKLRILGSVGEPINPEAWKWFFENVGRSRCPIVDTWWQTETGGIMITPLPGATPLKPGSATLPFFGVQPVLLDDQGKEISGEGSGKLCLKSPWPGMMRGVYGDPGRFFETYFSQHKGYYFTGDGCHRDGDGYYWITGRIDDVLNVSGHRLGTAELESALVAHHSVAEAAVVGYPHDIKGQGIYAFVTLKAGIEASDELREELRKFVAVEISPIAKPDVIQWAPALPKTRSGKIMRRILRKIAEGQTSELGDVTTLADPSVVEELVRGRTKG